MRRLFGLGLLLIGAAACGRGGDALWREGDILFQTSRSAQSQAIQQATHSRWSHMGMLFRKQGRWMVLEAVQPVKYTPVEAWIRRGEGGLVVARRIHGLNPEDAHRLQIEGERYLGRPYDLTFEWSDDRIYCSELVWKAYDRALGLQLGRLQQLKEFDLSPTAVRSKMKERYPGSLPLDEPVISPEAIFESPRLEAAWSR